MIRLVPGHPDHAALWWTWRQDPAGRRHNPYDDLDVDALRERLAVDDRRWFIEDDGGLLGTVSLRTVTPRMGTAEVGYMVDPRYAGQGVATAALRLLVGVAFGRLSLRRLTALIAAENVASHRVVEKVGFVREGVLRAHVIIEGREVDEVMWGLLRRDWAG